MSGAMRWNGGARLMISAFALMASATAGAGDEIDPQDGEMLEFLGSWEAEDDDWLIVSMEELVLEADAREAGGDERAEAAKDER